MRKTFAAVIAMLLLGMVVWGWLQSQRKSSYACSSVEAEVRRLALSSGTNLIDERTVAASVRGLRVGFFDSLARKISGKPPLDDLVEFTFLSGPDTIHATIYHSHGWAKLIEIRSNSKSSKPATAIAAGLTTSSPKLDCRLIVP